MTSPIELKTPIELSPYRLIQEELRDQPWRLLVAVILLNQTTALAARPILKSIFKIWPSAEDLSQALPEMVANVIRPLGLQNRRAKALIKMSQHFLKGFDDPEDLPGIGKYGADSYNMFCRGYLILDVKDKELKNYLEWALTRSETISEGTGEDLCSHPFSVGQKSEGSNI